MLHYLSEYASVEDFGYEHVLPLSILPAELDAKVQSTLRLTHRDCPVTPILYHHYPALLGIRSIQAVHVQHCHGAKAVAITFPFPPSSNDAESGAEKTRKPFKLAYSGDCRPSAKFAAIGRGSTVLIHEATFEDELVGEARAKKHSTVKEALGVGSLMQAKAVVLTHFSQRYQKIPVLDNFWGNRRVVEAAIKGEDEQQERLTGIEADEDEIRGAVEEEGNEVALPEIPAPEEEGAEIMEWTPSTTTSPAANSTASSSLKPDDMKVVIAFDYMRVKLRDMPKMEAFRPALAKLFESEIGNETRVKRGIDGIDAESANGDVKSKPAKKGKQERQKLSQVVKENLEAKRDEEVLKKATEGK
jgi:ribonuclease Z